MANLSGIAGNGEHRRRLRPAFRATRGRSGPPWRVQDGNKGAFARKLKSVLAECERVLKPAGLLAFTYHHSRDDGWEAVAEAVVGAGFVFVAAQPVKSEMSVATPKSQTKDPIDIDVVLVCRKRHLDTRPLLCVETAAEVAASAASEKIEQFTDKRTALTRADERVILLSQLLVALSASRDAPSLVAGFRVARSGHGAYSR